MGAVGRLPCSGRGVFSALLYFSYFFVTRQGSYKVWLPGSASIVRKRLLNMMRIWSDIRPDDSNEDRSIIECFLIEKLPPPILELTDHRLIQDAGCAVGKILTPLMRLRIVKK